MSELVSDAGPLISFARAHQIELLRRIVSQLIVPQEVYDEVVVAGVDRPGADEVAQADWITVESVADPASYDGISSSLGTGERSALALARERGCPVLIDERSGRKMAAALGLETVTTLLLLADAKARNLIPKVRPVLDEIMAAGFHLSSVLYNDYLQNLGEGQGPS